jgi:uncharacterized BrkB/YihY/UPF0761 family membrane protein
MRDDDPLYTYSHVWAWPYVIAAVAFSIVVFMGVYWFLPDR